MTIEGYRPPTIEELNDTIAKERKRANDAWAATMMEREVAEAYKDDAMRYRFLRDLITWPSANDAARVCRFDEDGNLRFLVGDSLNKAIDAAIHAATAGSPE